MKKKIYFLLLLFSIISIGVWAQVETEPNNSFATANELPYNTQYTGTIGCSGDADDYFKAAIPANKKIRIYLEYTNNGASGGAAYFYVYDKNQGGIVTGHYNSIGASATVYDTIELYCRNDDSMYFRMQQYSQCIDYKITYEVVAAPATAFDGAGNDSYASAVYFSEGDTIKGSINYTANGVTDGSDYFVTKTPRDGMLRVYIERTNTSSSNSSYCYLYLDNKNQSNFYGNLNGYVNAGVTRTDTLDFYCRAADTTYFRISNGNGVCFSYRLRYEVINNHPLAIDTAGNDGFASARYFSEGDTIKGTIDYNANGVTDGTDYFVTNTPRDGMLRVYIERTNTSSSNSSYCYLHLFNKNQSNFYANLNGYVNAGDTRTDTLDFYCRAADTTYFRISDGNGVCFSYRLRYEVLNNHSLAIDTEGNDSYASAVYFSEGDTIKGTINYAANSVTDGTDYFVTKTPRDGMLRVYIERTNTSNSNSSYCYLHLFNKNQSNFYANLNGYVNAGDTRTDTLDFYCRAADTTYFRISDGNGVCFSYRLRYEVLNNHPLAIDTEGNDSYAAARYFSEGDTVKGTINYTANGVTDGDDYFVTKTPRDGMLRVYIERTNTGSPNSQYVYLSLYDSNHSQFYNDYNGYVNAGQTRYDTINIYCRSADTTYFRISNATVCFSYKIRYEVVSIASGFVKAIDTIPNETIAAATYFNAKDTIKGNIGYSKSGVTDNDDYFKTYVPDNGTVRVYIERTNANNANSQYVYFSLYDKNQSQFYSNFNGYVNPEQTRYDTLDFYCRTADTMYFRMSTASSCFDYKIWYEVTLGPDTTLYVCPGFTTDISQLYNTQPFDVVTYTNMSGGSMPPLNAVPDGLYRLTVEYTPQSCSKDTAFIAVGLYPKPNIGNDTAANVCPGFTADLTQFKNTSGFTTQWLGTSTPSSVGAGTYTLIVTNPQGCMDTAVITIGLYPKPNIGNDTTVNICAGFNTDITGFKNTTGLATQWLGTSTPSSVGAGTYTLIVTNPQGCMDTAVITIGLHPKPNLGNDTTIYAWIGESVNFVNIKDTMGFGAMGLTAQWFSNINGGSGNTTVNISAADTVAANLIVTNTSGCKDTINITIYPVKNILPSIGGIGYNANVEVADTTSGWTNYYYNNGTPADKADDILLLSLKKNGNPIGSIGDGTFAVNNTASVNAGNNAGVQITNPLMSNPSGYYVMHRYWKVIATSQPTGSVGVRFYFNAQDYDDANGSYGNSKAIQQMVFYHLKDGNPDPSTNWAGATLPVISIVNGSIPNDTVWTYSLFAPDKHLAEFTVSSFSGGGGGFTGNNNPLPIDEVSFKAAAHKKDAILNWAAANEENLTQYEIEQSIDGDSFEQIGIQSVKGGKGNAYQYTAKGIGERYNTVYYRLKLILANNSHSYTPVARVLFAPTGYDVAIAPNPANAKITVTGADENDGLVVLDMNGKVVISQTAIGRNKDIDVSGLSNGNYLVQIIHQKTIYSIKLSKQ